MNWIFLVLASHLSWAIENVYTKIVIGSKIKNPYVFLVLITLMSVIFLPLIGFRHASIPSINILGWLWFTSILYNISSIPYVKAMEIEEVTRINILWNAIPIFSLVLGWLIIGDKISILEFAAMIFLLAGAVTASLKKSNSSFKISASFWLMLLSCGLYSVYALAVRYLSQTISFYTIFFWVILLDSITILLAFFFKRIRQDFAQTIRTNNFSFFVLFLIVAAIGNFGILLNQWALSLKPGALVYSFEGFQVLCVFFLALIGTKFFPKAISESTDKKDLLIKFLSFLLILIGIFLLMF